MWYEFYDLCPRFLRALLVISHIYVNNLLIIFFTSDDLWKTNKYFTHSIFAKLLHVRQTDNTVEKWRKIADLSPAVRNEFLNFFIFHTIFYFIYVRNIFFSQRWLRIIVICNLNNWILLTSLIDPVTRCPYCCTAPRVHFSMACIS